MHGKHFLRRLWNNFALCSYSAHLQFFWSEVNGYALKHHEKNRLIFLFEPRNQNDKVPFDLTTFKYVPMSQAAEISNKIKAQIVAILHDTGAPIWTRCLKYEKDRIQTRIHDNQPHHNLWCDQSTIQSLCRFEWKVMNSQKGQKGKSETAGKVPSPMNQSFLTSIRSGERPSASK